MPELLRDRNDRGIACPTPKSLMDEAKQRSWGVISMQDDWRTIFADAPK